MDAPKLLLIAPIRCERYLQRHEDQPLLAAIHKEYAGLINFLGRMKKDIAVAITPVQTPVSYTHLDVYKRQGA